MTDAQISRQQFRVLMQTYEPEMLKFLEAYKSEFPISNLKIFCPMQDEYELVDASYGDSAW